MDSNRFLGQTESAKKVNGTLHFHERIGVSDFEGSNVTLEFNPRTIYLFTLYKCKKSFDTKCNISLKILE